MLGISWAVVFLIRVFMFHRPALKFGNRIKTLQSSFTQIPVMCVFHFNCVRMITV